MVDYSDKGTQSAGKKYMVKRQDLYLSSCRVKQGCNAIQMSCSYTESKAEGLQFCTKAAAMTFMASIEHHQPMGFDLVEVAA